jgi:hypothetical protein
MEFESWRAFYRSDLQGIWALLPVPAALLGYLLVSRRVADLAARSAEARFVRNWSLLFAAETLLDPLIGGGLTGWLAPPAAVTTAVMLGFVLLGDFRVYWLVLALGDARRPARSAAAVTPIVPLAAWVAAGLAERVAPDPGGMRLWLIHELLFTAVALWLRGAWLPRRALPDARLRFLRGVCAYVAVYYALWAVSDGLVLAAGLDAAWLLRVVPNQLYYSFWVPFVWFRYASRR